MRLTYEGVCVVPPELLHADLHQQLDGQPAGHLRHSGIWAPHNLANKLPQARVVAAGLELDIRSKTGKKFFCLKLRFLWVCLAHERPYLLSLPDLDHRRQCLAKLGKRLTPGQSLSIISFQNFHFFVFLPVQDVPQQVGKVYVGAGACQHLIDFLLIVSVTFN